MYVAGTTEFDATDESGDWPAGPFWLPEGRYVRLIGLSGEDEDYRLTLSYVVGLVRELRPHESVPYPISGVAVGFDDGDFEIVWPEGEM